MKTWEKVVLGLTILGIVAFAAWILFMWFDTDDIIPSDSIEYHTKEELTDLYWQNKVVLNSVKDSVLSSTKMLQALDEYNEGDYNISYLGDKRFFNDEEWENIVSVFEKLHPYMIMLDRKGRPLKFYIDFSDLKLETGTKRVTLYWFPNEEEIEYRKEHSFADSIEVSQLDGNWYIVEEIYPWS